MSFHREAVEGDRHPPADKTYNDIAARDADTDWQITENLYKVVYVKSPPSAFALNEVSPTVWFNIAGATTLEGILVGGNTTGGNDIVVDTGDVITITDAPVDPTDGVNKTALDLKGDATDVALNTTHRTSAGTDHSDVGLNNTHRGSAGTDHSDVGLNNTHRGSDGSDHSFLDQDVTSGSGPDFATQLPLDDSTTVATTEYVDDAVAAGGGGTDISCKVTKSSSQTIADGIDEIVTWDQEIYDTDDMHDNSTDNERITIKTAGKYNISCYAAWGISAVGRRIIEFLKNGSSMAQTQYVPINKAQHTTSYVGEFDVGDYIEVSVFQDSGGDLNFLSGERYFEAHKIN